MLLSLLAAFAAAACFGVAAVLQGVGTTRTSSSHGLDPGLLLRLLRQPVFLVSLVLNLLGFVLHVVALESLPLFLAQAIIASSVAVTAVLATRVFHVRLSGQQWAAVGTVCVGLAALAGTAEAGTRVTAGDAVRPGIGVILLVVAVLGSVAARQYGPLSAELLGLLGGVAYGMVAVAARVLGETAWPDVPSDSATYLLLLSGALAYLLYTTAMQHGSVTTTTAALVVTQTAVPSLVGVVLLGDSVRAGLAPLAVLGFLLALGGAVALGRFEHVDSTP